MSSADRFASFGKRKATRARIQQGETTRGASEEPDNRFRSVQHARNINGTETVGRVTVRNLYTSIRVISSDSISVGVAVYDAVGAAASLVAASIATNCMRCSIRLTSFPEGGCGGKRRFPGTRRLYSLPGWIQRPGLELIGPTSS